MDIPPFLTRAVVNIDSPVKNKRVGNDNVNQ